MRPGILIFHAENAELREGAGEKATQETNYEHETVSFVALLTILQCWNKGLITMLTARAE
jgi:hypothetical protein